MLPAHRCVAVRARPCARCITSSMIRCSQGTTQMQALSPGQLISKLNRESLGKNDEHLIAVKRALDQAAVRIFQGHATGQHQGSTSAGTGLQGVSDWDFMVRFTDAVADPSIEQRRDFLEAARSSLLQKGVSSKYETGDPMSAARQGRNRVKLSAWQESQPIGEFDVFFEKYPGTVRLPPNNKKLADSQEAQQVVRYIKKLSAICTVSQGRVQAGIASNPTAPGVERLEQPKSMYLEDLVLSEEEKLLQAHGLLEAVPHFEALLKRTLQAVASRPAAYNTLLQKARLASNAWAAVASALVNYRDAQGGWLWVDGVTGR